MTTTADLYEQLQAAIVEYGSASYREGMAFNEGCAAREEARTRTDAAITAVIRRAIALRNAAKEQS